MNFNKVNHFRNRRIRRVTTDMHTKIGNMEMMLQAKEDHTRIKRELNQLSGLFLTLVRLIK